MQSKIVTIKKTDQKLQIIYGEVYKPNVVDTDGDYMTAEEIRKTAHSFLETFTGGYINREHEGDPIDAAVVESFIARENDDIFVPGSWVVGVHISDPLQWAAVEKGDINAFSLEGMGFRESKVVEIELDTLVNGETNKVCGHVHKFEARYNDFGIFLGGSTSFDVGHSHTILKGTATEEVEGHSHSFNLIEVVVS